ncbi:hypothetical protein DFH28DRAFT_945261 [Melampsora americana]|nr:hypothetical protein DFH28DRAFT_945261 [Melampsora americana]
MNLFIFQTFALLTIFGPGLLRINARSLKFSDINRRSSTLITRDQMDETISSEDKVKSESLPGFLESSDSEKEGDQKLIKWELAFLHGNHQF